MSLMIFVFGHYGLRSVFCLRASKGPFNFVNFKNGKYNYCLRFVDEFLSMPIYTFLFGLFFLGFWLGFWGFSFAGYAGFVGVGREINKIIGFC